MEHKTIYFIILNIIVVVSAIILLEYVAGEAPLRTFTLTTVDGGSIEIECPAVDVDRNESHFLVKGECTVVSGGAR